MASDDQGDPIPEQCPDPAAGLGAVSEGGKPKLSKEQIAAVSADIAAVTKTMQEQLAAISQEVNSLKGQIDGGAGGLGDIKKELDSLRDKAGILDAKSGQRPGTGGFRQRQLGSNPRDTAADRGSYGGIGRNARSGGLGSGEGRWAGEDRRLLDDSLREQMRTQGKREKPGTSWRTVFIVTFLFMMLGPFRQIVFKLFKQLVIGKDADRSHDAEFEF